MSERRYVVSGVPLTEEALMAKALRTAGVEVGSVGGDDFRRVAAQRLLESPSFAALVAARVASAAAEAWDEGYDARVRFCRDGHHGNPERNPYPAVLAPAADAATGGEGE